MVPPITTSSRSCHAREVAWEEEDNPFPPIPRYAEKRLQALYAEEMGTGDTKIP